MNQESQDQLINTYSQRLLNLLLENAPVGPRTYGFEYEFISSSPLTLEHMGALYSFLPENGFFKKNGYFKHLSGVYVTFEPGGQIEYHSMPLLPDDDVKLNNILSLIEQTNTSIKQTLNIDYLAKGYMPGREDVPLCLTDKRYKNLHARMPKCGTRGREMMKGTASIHLHVLIRNRSEIVPVFTTLCAMAEADDFKMQDQRRDIWNNTDPCRCGNPYQGINPDASPEHIIRELTRVSVLADVLGEDIPFFKSHNTSFNSFLYHLTTIFTDVRLNMKGPTFEFRTIDSISISEFTKLWKNFISIIEKI